MFIPISPTDSEITCLDFVNVFIVDLYLTISYLGNSKKESRIVLHKWFIDIM